MTREATEQRRDAVRARLEEQARQETELPCVACSECDGRHHVGTTYIEWIGDRPVYCCKHCDETFPDCPDCGGPLVDGECRGDDPDCEFQQEGAHVCK